MRPTRGLGCERFPTTATVDTHVLWLRQKLETDPEHPVHGPGYEFVA
jgi:DNA-binding response OmpR family regulator